MQPGFFLRSMAEFVTTSTVARELFDWLQFSYVPDEHFYSTLATVRVDKDGVSTYIKRVNQVTGSI